MITIGKHSESISELPSINKLGMLQRAIPNAT